MVSTDVNSKNEENETYTASYGNHAKSGIEPADLRLGNSPEQGKSDTPRHPWANKFRTQKSIDLTTGIRMSYVEAGNPKGNTLLFLHGYSDTSRSFENLMKALLTANPDLRLIAPDLRGHGKSSVPTPDKSNPFEMEDFAEDILDFMRFKNLTKVHLVGHSMGSVIAQEIALEHPGKVVSLTMIGAFVNGKKNRAIQEFLMPELVKKWQLQLQQEYGAAWKTKSFSLTPSDLGDVTKTFLREQWVTDSGSKAQLLNAIYQETIEVPLATWFGAMEALSEMDNSQRMKALMAPTLIIWGSKDEITTREDQNRLLDACGEAYERNATPIYLKSYADSPDREAPGHNLHWGKAEDIASDILEFTTRERPFRFGIKILTKKQFMDESK